MKKIIPLFLIIFLLITSYFIFYPKNIKTKEISSEKKELNIKDKIPPVLTLKDGNITITKGEKYIEPGYTATDNIDGDITDKVKVSTDLDINTIGTYTLTYSVQDSSKNNSTSQTRTVTVKDKLSEKITKYVNTKTNNQEINSFMKQLENYLSNYNVSIGYINLNNNFTYLYQAEKEYNGASLIKVIDAMYVYENNILDKETKENVKQAISVSNNQAHSNLIKKIGKENLMKYIKSIGGRKVSCSEDFYCQTNIHDQLTYWLHLNELLKTHDKAQELKEYFINDYGNYLSFSYNYDNLHKYGNSNRYFHDVGLFYNNQNPYIIVVLTKEREENDQSVSKLIRTISKEINELNNLTSTIT